MTDNRDSSLAPYIKAASGKKGIGLVALDVHELTSIADAFIILSGRSNRQVVSIADFIQSELKEQGIRPLSLEGKNEGLWVLIDYGHVVIHIFHEPVRRFYDIEGLWIDAPKIDLTSILNNVKNSGRNQQ